MTRARRVSRSTSETEVVDVDAKAPVLVPRRSVHTHRSCCGFPPTLPPGSGFVLLTSAALHFMSVFLLERSFFLPQQYSQVFDSFLPLKFLCVWVVVACLLTLKAQVRRSGEVEVLGRHSFASGVASFSPCCSRSLARIVQLHRHVLLHHPPALVLAEKTLRTDGRALPPGAERLPAGYPKRAPEGDSAAPHYHHPPQSRRVKRGRGLCQDGYIFLFLFFFRGMREKCKHPPPGTKPTPARCVHGLTLCPPGLFGGS